MKLFWPIEMGFEQAIEEINMNSTFTPFDKEVLLFTQALSKTLVRMRQMPEVVALGYWLRKANIQEMKVKWEEQNKERFIKPRGTVFHIAPSNVDTIFVYSWMLSLLAGNRNIIRVSGKGHSNVLLDLILTELAKPEFEKIAKQTIICTYNYDEKFGEMISEICHTRVIWGGNDTVQTIRQIQLNPMANELAFPDRFSLAAISAEAVLNLGENELNELLDKFYNDVFWFDQMACSSPRLIAWCGKQHEKAKVRFWSAFENKVKNKRYELMAATQVLKYTTSLWLSTETDVRDIENGKYFSRVHVVDVPIEARERHCGGGLFFEYDVEHLSDLSKVIIDKDQTLAYFGFEHSTLQVLVDSISTRGLDRIVPIGQALNFDGVWDGQSFLKSFTREVVII
ncbi:acyl-CoA reductase [Ureibacillus sinduriensis]|uniref:Acyl-CoA reductase n=1 Tax=Ureibacillus sinduriensis BLB-1 = JCM 15800 TaxID=1384057 RepID=A0A0A3HVK0_9BACL|nr:acyl-CoA reductase [Ureibacillus sinduriensis]KGR76474.1 acyl-CoA reductase [Ureibacillus sinduriensis BLB-1 = JCM 15800]